MPITTSTTISLVLHRGDLHAAQVSAGPMGGRARHIATVESIARAHAEQARAALAPVPRNGKVVLSLPSAMCAVRPIAINSAMWATARDEIESTITRLMPFDAGDAMIGMIDRMPQPGSAPGDAAPQRTGYLIGASRSACRPLIDTIETALGRPIDRIQTVHHALLGLGLQREPVAEVLESVSGATLRHRLRFGLPESLAEPVLGDHAPRTLALPGAQAPPDAQALTPTDIATGAALAPIVASEAFRPMVGAVPVRAMRWLAPAAIAAAALALAFVAVNADRARWREATDRIEARRADHAPTLAEVQALRDQVQTLNARLARINQVSSDWAPVVPTLAAAREVLPDNAIFYEVVLSPTQVSIQGEAPRASDVIQRLESSPAFADAEPVGPTSRVEERGAERFHLSARRERSSSGRATP